MGKKRKAREKARVQARAELDGEAPDTRQIAARLWSVTLQLHRWLAHANHQTGITGPRLSALSSLVHGGPRTMGALAADEGIRAPSTTRLVSALETEGLVERGPDPRDGRHVIVRATERGAARLWDGSDRRIDALARLLEGEPPTALATVDGAMGILEHAIRATRG
jgi:DNA-binding MarR family transcriptional regulator